MIKIKPEQKKAIIITGGIILIVLVIGLKIIYQPQQAKTIKLKSEIKKEMERNSLIRGIISQQDDIKRYQNRFSPHPDAAWLEDKLRQLAEDLKIELIDFNPKGSQQISGFLQLTVEAKIKGNYHQIGKLISRLEKSPEFIEVKKIKMVSVSSEAWDKLAQTAEVVATPGGWRRRGQTVDQEEAKSPKISPLELQTILNKSQQAQITLEVCTLYVQ